MDWGTAKSVLKKVTSARCWQMGASKGRYLELVTLMCWVQRSVRGTCHSPSSSSEVRNEWTGTSTTSYALMALRIALPLLLPSRSAHKRKKCAWDASVVLLHLPKIWLFWHSLGRIMRQTTNGCIEGSVRIFWQFLVVSAPEKNGRDALLREGMKGNILQKFFLHGFWSSPTDT